MSDSSYSARHLAEVRAIVDRLDAAVIERIALMLADLRQAGGRLFFLGVGGSAANCSHAVNDFRKLAGIEAYTPVDNVSELTARTNDEGWETIFAAWLKGSRLRATDLIFVFSGGGAPRAGGALALRFRGGGGQPGAKRQRERGARAKMRARPARQLSASSG